MYSLPHTPNLCPTSYPYCYPIPLSFPYVPSPCTSTSVTYLLFLPHPNTRSIPLSTALYALPHTYCIWLLWCTMYCYLFPLPHVPTSIPYLVPHVYPLSHIPIPIFTSNAYLYPLPQSPTSFCPLLHDLTDVYTWLVTLWEDPESRVDYGPDVLGFKHGK